jgi:hypothetical protein
MNNQEYIPQPFVDYMPAIAGRKFIARRCMTDGILEAKTILSILKVISDGFGIAPLSFVGNPPKQMKLDMDSIQILMDTERYHNAKNIQKPLVFTEQPGHGKIQLIISISPRLGWPIEELEIPLPENLDLEQFISVVQTICPIYGAFHGYVYDNLLDSLHGREWRAHRISEKKTYLHPNSIPLPPLPIEGVIDTLPELLLDREFDIKQVPNGVWWVNYWTNRQVQNIGLTKIKDADFFKLIEMNNGEILSVLTHELTSVTNQEHMTRISRIIEKLELRKSQECFLV